MLEIYIMLEMLEISLFSVTKAELNVRNREQNVFSNSVSRTAYHHI